MTNMSTGKLGVTLANFLTDADQEVICLKGAGSTYPGAVRAARVETFATNDDLAQLLESISRQEASTRCSTPPRCVITKWTRC